MSDGRDARRVSAQMSDRAMVHSRELIARSIEILRRSKRVLDSARYQPAQSVKQAVDKADQG
jgi:hypothetical protein